MLLKIYNFIQTKVGYKKFGLWSFINPIWSRVWNKDCISVWSNCSLWKRTSLLVSVDYNWKKYDPYLSIWNNVCIWNDLFLACIDEIVIEDNVLFSDRVFITDHIHDYVDIHTPILYQDLKKKGKVLIKKGSFIWINAVILPWVTIWKNSVVGASSVVTQNIPDYCVATWNPAKIIKKYDIGKQKWTTF